MSSLHLSGEKKPARIGKTGFSASLGAIALFALLAAGCSRETEPVLPDIRPVRTVTVEKQDLGDSVRLTGHIRARDEAAIGFRIGGRMIARLVNLGDRIESGQTIARLEPLDETNAVRSAQANLNAANSVVVRVRNDFERQRTLLRQGHTTQARFDQAQQELQTALAKVKDGEAQLQIAQDRLSFTELKADTAGVVSAVRAEPGEVVAAGQPVIQLARDSGRDAVFDVPANVLRAAPVDTEVTVSLTSDPRVEATGSVREVAPQADPVTRNFQVRVGLNNPPDAMRLGSTVTGVAKLPSSPLISIPASALTQFDSKPAVWVVDKANNTVAIKAVEIKRHEPSSVLISGGLDNGDIVVTAGVQALYPGRKVRLLGASS